jgi:pilus assembly protein Flp/PilA
MSEFVKLLVARLVREEDGQDMVEYAALVALIAVVAAVGVATFGTELNTWFDAVAGQIPLGGGGGGAAAS